MPSPNLFDFATKELSQDAVICWLLAWADADATEGPADGGLRRCGRTFVDALFARWSEWPVELGENIRIEVRRQQNRIDVLARVDCRYLLLIEDKTDTGAHDDQLDRYRASVLNGETPFGKVALDDLYPIYVRTGNHSLRDRENAERSDYKVFDRADFLRVLDTYGGSNPILLDFRGLSATVPTRDGQLRQLDAGDHAERGKEVEEVDKVNPSRGWEGLYRFIEENASNDWWPLQDKAGTFWGLCMEPRETSDTSKFALWIEENRISFRLYGALDRESLEGMNREKEYWANAFIESGGGRLTKPSRFAATKTKPMCVAEWQGWLAFGADGRVDMDETVKNLNWARETLSSTITGHRHGAAAL